MGKPFILAAILQRTRWPGRSHPENVSISTRGLRSVLRYEPRDLTISVEAGLPYAKFRALLAKNRQRVPLDPPFSERATVGGVIAANHSGPQRRRYGSTRDLVIGASFVTLDGKLVQSGGMVVKNVAGRPRRTRLRRGQFDGREDGRDPAL